MTYYVVKDLNTNLYFRGKGVNKWGKYFNQASIYRLKAMAENAVTEENRRGANCVVIPIQIIETSEPVKEVKYGSWTDHYQSGITVESGVVSTCCDMWNATKTDFCPRCGAEMK